MQFKLVDVVNGLVHVQASGPIAPDTPEQLTQELLALVGPNLFSQNLLLNLADADFISSAGIGGLLQSNRRFEEERGNLLLKNPSRTVRQTLEMMRLGSVLQIES